MPADTKMPAQTKMRFAFDIFVILFFAYTAWDALDFRTLAQYLPLTVSGLAIILSLLALVIDYRNWKRTGTITMGEVSETAALYKAEETEMVATAEEGAALPPAMQEAAAEAEVDEEADDPRVILRRAGYMVLWTLAYIVAIWVIGLLVATAVFLVTFLVLVAHTGWKVPVFGTIIVVAGIMLLGEMLNLSWPDYVLQRFWA